MGPKCQPEAAVYGTYFNLIYLSQYLDLEEMDPEKIVKNSIEGKNFLVLDPKMTKKLDLYFMENMIHLDDSIFKVFRNYVDVDFIEQAQSFTHSFFDNPDKPANERLYGSFYFR